MQGSEVGPPAALDGASSGRGSVEILEITISSHSCSGAIPDPEPWSRAYPHTHAVPTHTYIYTCPICVYSHVRSHVCMHVQCTDACIHISTCGHTIHICMYVCISEHVCTHMHTYVNMCILANTRCIYLWTYMWAPISTHAQMWAPTQTQCTYTQTPNTFVHCTRTHMQTHTLCGRT